MKSSARTRSSAARSRSVNAFSQSCSMRRTVCSFSFCRSGLRPNVKIHFIAATLALLLIRSTLIAQMQHQTLDLALPTDNDALFSGGGPAFYQYIERDFKGVKSTPWEGGQYGFVRDPIETSTGIVYTRFHEGIDIKPLHRDARGEPLDEVRAIARGKVVCANLAPSLSNYGKYVVVEHTWDGSSYYSLYGHLASIAVQPGREIARGE